MYQRDEHAEGYVHQKISNDPAHLLLLKQVERANNADTALKTKPCDGSAEF